MTKQAKPKSADTKWEVIVWPITRFVAYAHNPRKNDHVIAQMEASIREFGFKIPMLARSDGEVVDGHLRLKAALNLGLKELPTILCDEWTPAQVKAFRIMVNKSVEWADWDVDMLKLELAELKEMKFDLQLTGFELGESDGILGGFWEPPTRESQKPPVPEISSGVSTTQDEVPDAPDEPVSRPGDIWLMGNHRLICGDCRDFDVIEKLLAGKLANIVITSPPYAMQRDYDRSSGFKPVPPEEYTEWFAEIAGHIKAILVSDGSYFLNIKEHADDGERNLYVKDLVLAHKRQWGWRFVDEFCWRKTNDGVPGGWNNRFKNAWEPIFHFCRQSEIKFRPEAVGHVSEDCFDYSPNNPQSPSGSGLLGSGPRGAAADGGKNQEAWQRSRKLNSRGHEGIARPSNVIEAMTESSQGSHSAPFPRGMPEFFIKAFTDAGDIVFDPFLGSGTTIMAAEGLERIGYGCEISPAYCDVIVTRWQNFTEKQAILEVSGRTFNELREASNSVAA